MAWNTVPAVQPGERAAIHYIVGRDDSVRKALFVGPEPLGKKGETAGRAVDARKVAEASVDDRDFDIFAIGIMRQVVHAGADEDTCAMATEFILQAVDRGAKEESQDRLCVHCGGSRAESKFLPDERF